MALAMATVTAGSASAQGITNKVIDTNQLVVKPTDTATSIVGGTVRYVSRVVAGTIDNNGIVRTLNNLFGRNESSSPQPNLGIITPLPPISAYQPGFFNSPIKPQMPSSMTIRR
jgi:hypothetical protein